MKQFAELYTRLDATTSSNAKLEAMRDYFSLALPEDAAWAVYFLAGGRPRQLVPTKWLRAMALHGSGIPEWLFEESYQAVGDLAETIALLLPDSEHKTSDGLAVWIERKLLPLRGTPPELLAQRLLPLLEELDRPAKLVCIKLITGSFRVGVSRLLVTRALASLAKLDPKRVAQRMVGYTDISAQPSVEDFKRLVAPEGEAAVDERHDGHPYPFFLAYPLQIPLEHFASQLGLVAEWQVEWKWDGIRGQLVKRKGQLWVWSRGEELVTDRFPELARLAETLPDGTVIDGEIVVWKEDRIQPFALLQQRIGRRTLTAKVLLQAPVALLAYDLLEWQGQDTRHHTQQARRKLLEHVVAESGQACLKLSPLLTGRNWAELAQQREASRSLGVEGMMLKRRDAQYGVGRTKDVGLWWKWKIDPYSVDAVLIYAQRGHGRRASLYTDFTFAVWDKDESAPTRKLVPFAKAYSGLTDAEMREVDAIIRKTTVEKFGPVRSVTPTLVFELGFEGIAHSSRHKSGIAVRFPRMLRWRLDKPVEEADTLEMLKSLLHASSPA